MNTGIKIVLSFVSGAVLGVFVAERVYRKKYEDIAKEEFESVMEYNRRGRTVREDERKTYKDIGVKEGYISYNNQLELNVESKKTLKRLRNVLKNDEGDDVNMDPYVISADAFDEEYSNFDKVTINYYSDENVLEDERDEPIEDLDEVIGHNALLCFGEQSNDPDIVYVRNERLGVDFEIIRTQRG